MTIVIIIDLFLLIGENSGIIRVVYRENSGIKL